MVLINVTDLRNLRLKNDKVVYNNYRNTRYKRERGLKSEKDYSHALSVVMR